MKRSSRRPSLVFSVSDPVNAGYLLGNASKNPLKTLRMLTLHELHDVAEVVAVDVEMRLGPGQRQAARRVRREIAEIPSLDEAAKSGNARVLFQGTERGYAEPAPVLQFDDRRSRAIPLS